MSGTLLVNRKINGISVSNGIIHADLAYCSTFLILRIFNRMSPSMVACIAVEAISILEKLHMKG